MVLCYRCLCARTDGITLSQLYSVLRNSALPWVVYGVLFHSAKAGFGFDYFALYFWSLKLIYILCIKFRSCSTVSTVRVISSLKRQPGWCSLANLLLLIQRIILNISAFCLSRVQNPFMLEQAYQHMTTDHSKFIEALRDWKLLDVCGNCSELLVVSLLRFMENMFSGLATYTVVCGMAIWLRAEPFK